MVSETTIQTVRKAMESTYDGVMAVEEYQKVRENETGFISNQPVVVLENQSCRLSFEKVQQVVQSENAATAVQTVKLFLAPEITIKANSKITVTQAGITTAYKASGIPAVYHTHQEIVLELFERWV